ncbi:MAG: sigma-70 family RNA polymerase sigma factor [Planctomycetota bacterium]
MGRRSVSLLRDTQGGDTPSCRTSNSLIPSRRLKGLSDVSNDLVLHRVASQDQGAVRECIDRYGGLVWSLARRLCPNSTDAEDAVQDIFVSVWRSAGRFDPEMGSEATFIATIARRRLIDRARRKKRALAAAPLEEGFAEAAGEDGTGQAERLATLGEDAKIAVGLLEELSEDQQRVLRMSIFHGVSHEKIAAATDMPLGTVKTHIRRGLLKARKILEQRQRNRTSGDAESTSVVRSGGNDSTSPDSAASQESGVVQ